MFESPDIESFLAKRPPNVDPLPWLREILPLLDKDNLRFVLKNLSRGLIREVYPGDRWLSNYYLNLWEYLHGATVLESFPWNVSIPAADNCNAKCQFCNSWLRGRSHLSVDQLKRFSEVLPYARHFGLQGHGEPLINASIEQILSELEVQLDPRVYFYIITNGLRLPDLSEKLLKAHVTGFNVSLNAVSSETHNTVMALGENVLPGIIESIRRLVAVRDSTHPRVQVTISMVLTADNIHEAPAFVRLGNELGVTTVYLRTLMPQPQITPGLNYHLLPPYQHPQAEQLFQETQREIEQSKVRIEAQPDSWRKPVFPAALQAQIDKNPPVTISRAQAVRDRDLKSAWNDARAKRSGRGRYLGEVAPSPENPFGREAHFECGFVYHNFMCSDLTFEVPPCCYMPTIPGHEAVVFDGEGRFFDYWNSPAFVALRGSLRSGPLMTACKMCPHQNRGL